MNTRPGDPGIPRDERQAKGYGGGGNDPIRPVGDGLPWNLRECASHFPIQGHNEKDRFSRVHCAFEPLHGGPRQSAFLNQIQSHTNWQGQPLRNYELILGFIGSTKTATGLRVQVLLNAKPYQRGIRTSDSQMRSIKMKKQAPLPQWNYIIG